MGPIYRDQFVSLHYFSMYSIPFLKLPKYLRLRKWGWRKLITMEIEGSKWSHHQKQTRNVQSFCDADPFFLSKKKKKGKKAQIKGQISLIKSNTNLVISEIKVLLRACCWERQHNKEAQKVAGCQV